MARTLREVVNRVRLGGHHTQKAFARWSAESCGGEQTRNEAKHGYIDAHTQKWTSRKSTFGWSWNYSRGHEIIHDSGTHFHDQTISFHDRRSIFTQFVLIYSGGHEFTLVVMNGTLRCVLATFFLVWSWNQLNLVMKYSDSGHVIGWCWSWIHDQGCNFTFGVATICTCGHNMDTFWSWIHDQGCNFTYGVAAIRTCGHEMGTFWASPGVSGHEISTCLSWIHDHGCTFHFCRCEKVHLWSPN